MNNTILSVRKNSPISNNTIKLIAIITMLIDHIGHVLSKYLFSSEMSSIFYTLCKSTGRIAFPLFCFLIVEGFCHTKNIKKYVATLLIFALISEIPFKVVLLGYYSLSEPIFLLICSFKNVIFTLLVGLLTLIVIKKVAHKSVLIQALVVLIGCIVVEMMGSDYGMMGVLYISGYYFCRKNRINQVLTMLNLFLLSSIFTPAGNMLTVLQIVCMIVPCIVILFYNGQRGQLNLKYFFYAFYPVHITLIGFILYFLQKG
ncbi:MAG: hypothetical protein ATN35_05430 [Epulopiscium sp. Nele67-Bin004]|nr:MAG: hypothetical protein ATN35_05430 [Epulopiscium sp. Nele67-Bin004]